ncbi:MAG: heavy-metal-associated domain-containing protein, partial [Anaerolineae bacterium]|nr:heavy-metal-associated domain-containing protein [Anaerolineae bacterium]
NVPAISCGHCVKTIERELKTVAGVQFVAADMNKKVVTVQLMNDGALARFKATMQEIGYPVAG